MGAITLREYTSRSIVKFVFFSFYLTFSRHRYDPDPHGDFVGDSHYVAVDTMTFTTNDIMCIGVKGRRKPFDSTGHRPILVGYDSLGRPNYVAVVQFGKTSDQYSFTCVADDASTVTYIDSHRIRTSHNFKVLVLRRDPCDQPTPTSVANEGSIPLDPTGRLFWKNDIDELLRVRWSGLDQELAAKLNMKKGEYITASSFA